jgi:hypothetical protein
MNYPIEAALILHDQLSAGKQINLTADELRDLVASYMSARATAWSLTVTANTLRAELAKEQGARDLATAPQAVANRGKNSLDDAYQARNWAEDDGA